VTQTERERESGDDYCWFSSKSNANGTNKRAFACAIRSYDKVEARPWL